MTNIADFFLFADAFGSNDARFDLDGSGTVDFGDFFLFADSFGQPARAKLLTLARKRIGLPGEPQLQQKHAQPVQQPDRHPLLSAETGSGPRRGVCVDWAASGGPRTGGRIRRGATASTGTAGTVKAAPWPAASTFIGW